MRKKEGPPRAVQLQFALAEGGDAPVLGGRKIAAGAESAVDNVLARAASGTLLCAAEGGAEDSAVSGLCAAEGGAEDSAVSGRGNTADSGQSAASGALPRAAEGGAEDSAVSGRGNTAGSGQSAASGALPRAAEGGGDGSACRTERFVSFCDLAGGAAKDGFVCAVTGHRVLSSDFSKEELRAALRALAAAGVRTFLCGMALGFDLLCAEEVLQLREELPVRLVACVPCADQAARYPKSARERYERILDRCDERAVLHERYCDGCMFERNRYMVDRADLLLAYYTGRRGGTKYTVGYAEKRGIPVYLI